MDEIGIIKRTTIDDLVARYRSAVALYGEAFESIASADALLSRAAGEIDAVAGSGRAYYGKVAPEVDAFLSAVKLPDRDQYLRVAERLTRLRFWSALVELTELDYLMDKEAKDQLRKQLAYIPEVIDRHSGKLINGDEIARQVPEFSVENIVSTVERWASERELTFRRGLANAFAKLDRRFRSHDGFKIGSRMVVARAFTESGSWNYYGNDRDTLIDVERAFLILDGKDPRAAYGGIVGKIDDERSGLYGARASVHEGDYFRVRIFRNGNAHLWFTRDDLLRAANRVLADYYGEVVGDGKDTPAAEPDPLDNVKLTPAKRFGFYPSPAAVAEVVVEAAESAAYGMAAAVAASGRRLRVLEPSAGTGALVARLRSGPLGTAYVRGIEVQPDLATDLRARRLFDDVVCADFLLAAKDMEPDYFDVVVMNPPFDRERDIDHVNAAFGLLRPGGVLVAVMSAGSEFRETAKAVAFREKMRANGAKWRDLPAGSFSEVGTNVNTLVLTVRKRTAS